MIINTKIRYGLRAMIELAANAGSKGLFQKDISERQEIPLKYLDQIISALKSAGLISNVRGKKSGYILTRRPSEINIYDIFRAFESELSIVPCLNDSELCNKEKFCAAHIFWSSLNNRIETFMIGQTLDKLASEQNILNQQKKDAFNFEI